jgi:hypothetical protein
MCVRHKFNYEPKEKPVFDPLGEKFVRKWKRIYYRDQRNGRATWISTKTDKMPLARKWKKNWLHQQWLLQSGVAPAQPAPAMSQTTTIQSLDESGAAGQLIGDKTGPSLIADEYGDVRPDHLIAIARKIRLTAKTRTVGHAGKGTKRRWPTR